MQDKEIYFTNLPLQVGGGNSLVAFRDAAINYAAARRRGTMLFVEAEREAMDLLAWLGIDAASGLAAGTVSYADPSRRSSLPSGLLQSRVLAAWPTRPEPPLEEFRRQGYLSEAMFAALIRSSYGPPSADFFPTRSELGFYFDEALLLQGAARWDSDYLAACQEFFMEELTPAELVSKSLMSLPAAQGSELLEQSARWPEELAGVTFLVASQLKTLQPLAQLLAGLLTPKPGPALGLKELVSGLKVWDEAAWSRAWRSQPSRLQEGLAGELCPEFTEQAETILFTAGPELLLWRSTVLGEALR